MIGSDAASLRWLRDQHQKLTSLGAVGLLVQADTEQDLVTVAEAAEGLSITPASGGDIALALGVKHYPVAITEGRLWQ